MKNLAVLLLLISLKSFGQEDTLQQAVGKTPGIIRCMASISKSEEPLYVLDGRAINAEELRKIDPETIASISFLKNSESINLCRSTNGVLLITTKKCSKRELRKMKKKD